VPLPLGKEAGPANRCGAGMQGRGLRSAARGQQPQMEGLPLPGPAYLAGRTETGTIPHRLVDTRWSLSGLLEQEPGCPRAVPSSGQSPTLVAADLARVAGEGSPSRLQAEAGVA